MTLHVAANVLNFLAYLVVWNAAVCCLFFAITNQHEREWRWASLGLFALPFLRALVWMLS